MTCKNCIHFINNRFYCSKLKCHVYLTDKCRYFKRKPNLSRI
ncbi:hypothetical protein [Halobacteroides halobius]|nr:hypothetical protein [Halobacteroides halobius]